MCSGAAWRVVQRARTQAHMNLHFLMLASSSLSFSQHALCNFRDDWSRTSQLHGRVACLYWKRTQPDREQIDQNLPCFYLILVLSLQSADFLDRMSVSTVKITTKQLRDSEVVLCSIFILQGGARSAKRLREKIGSSTRKRS